MLSPTLRVREAAVYQGFLSKTEQQEIVDALRPTVLAAPLFMPQIAAGKKMSVQMTSAGKVGWYTDIKGYRYIEHHPNGAPWPEIPPSILAVWDKLGVKERVPDSCLINYYGENASMGMHQDKDENCLDWPVISISLGDDALFRMGNDVRGGKTQSIWLKSGDVVVLEGASRMAFHGVDKIRFQSSNLLRNGGRINVTLRVAG